ncbi:MAG TPA: hypothetical protein VN153_05000, partial [Tahibacter sp.]|nr:hypothetical protein [Tahibacter sp.]
MKRAEPDPFGPVPCGCNHGMASGTPGVNPRFISSLPTCDDDLCRAGRRGSRNPLPLPLPPAAGRAA